MVVSHPEDLCLPLRCRSRGNKALRLQGSPSLQLRCLDGDSAIKVQEERAFLFRQKRARDDVEDPSRCIFQFEVAESTPVVSAGFPLEAVRARISHPRNCYNLKSNAILPWSS